MSRQGPRLPGRGSRARAAAGPDRDRAPLQASSSLSYSTSPHLESASGFALMACLRWRVARLAFKASDLVQPYAFDIQQSFDEGFRRMSRYRFSSSVIPRVIDGAAASSGALLRRMSRSMEALLESSSAREPPRHQSQQVHGGSARVWPFTTRCSQLTARLLKRWAQWVRRRSSPISRRICAISAQKMKGTGAVSCCAISAQKGAVSCAEGRCLVCDFCSEDLLKGRALSRKDG